MKVEEVQACKFTEWYLTVQDLSIRSIAIPLTTEFTDYLLSDGVVLPKSVQCTNGILKNGRCEMEEVDEEDDDEDKDDDWDDDNCAEAPDFGDFERCVSEAIEELGGAVMPKLDWSAPQDALWATFENSLRCTTFTDICLLLKSSDFIVRDLTQPFIQCEDVTDDNRGDVGSHPPLCHHLVLKKWVNIQPGLEFRCFVKNHSLIAISQRHYSRHYEFLPAMKAEITDSLTHFFCLHIHARFPLSCYVFDVYRDRKKRWRIIDFNPFGPITDSPLFDWTELDNWNSHSEVPEFRYIECERMLRSSPYQSNALPSDVVDLYLGQDANKLVDFLQLKARMMESKGDDSSDEDTDESSRNLPSTASR